MTFISRKSVFILTFSVSLLLLFQNCETGFKTQQQGSQNLELGTAQPQPEPISPVANNNPQITAPATPISIGMNVAYKIIIPITDSDTNTTLVNYVIRSAPQQGVLTLDPGSVAAENRGVTYTPNRNFVGSDSFMLNVIDPQGNMGPDQRFTINVEAKGIGQMIGTFAKQVCNPNTSPVTGTYISSEAAYELRQTIYSQNCETPIFEHIMTGNHAVGLENIMTLGNVPGFEYNVTNSRITMRPLSTVAAQAMNAQNYCGLNGWAANVVRDITVTGCNGVWAGLNIFMYRRVEFPVGQPPRLFYSSATSGGLGISPQTRTQGLDLATPFVRQQ